MPEDESCIISRYIPNPLLINGLKFDLRIYVVVTSIEPLRIYIYNEGLTRFATEKYKLSDCKTNRFAHLTNYSVNKKNEKFVNNTGVEEDGKGFKWSLSSLFKHLQAIQIDTELLWSRIYDVIIKSIIAGEAKMSQGLKRLGCHRSNCFELFGYDVLIDSELRPWLIEVNLAPSLACESPLDFLIKSNLVADTFTLIGVQPFDRKRDGFYRQRMDALSGFRSDFSSASVLDTKPDDTGNASIYARLKVAHGVSE